MGRGRSLVLIKDHNVSGNVSSIDLGGTDWDSSYDVYMVSISNLGVNADGAHPYLRLLDSSNNAVTTSEYDWSRSIFQSNATIASGGLENQSFDYFTNHSIDSADGESVNSILWLYEFNNSNEYSYYSTQTSNIQSSNSYFQNFRGGGVLTQNAVHKGIHLYLSGGAYNSGNLRLYGLRK